MYNKTAVKEVTYLRLDKFLCDCGTGSRSDVKKIIKSGRVSLDELPCTDPNTKIDENKTKVYLNGKQVVYRKYIYLMLNKPPKFVSAVKDNKLPVITSLVPEEYRHFSPFPVGRLDIDTVGLIILTNDGDLTHKITSPNHHIPKTYIAKVTGFLTDADVSSFEKEMDLDDFKTMPASLEILSASETESVGKVTVYEGKFHQVKRMFAHTGHTVTHLKRTSVNHLTLDASLPEGSMRELSNAELELLTYGI